MTAQPYRQRRILQQLKYPKESRYGSTSYSETRKAIKDYFINHLDSTYLENAIIELENKEPANDFQEDMIRSSIAALELVIDSDHSHLQDISFENFSGQNKKLDIEGVQVSVFPDLILRTERHGESLVGGMKIHIAKTFGLDEKGSEYVSTVLYSFIEDYVLEDSEDLKHKLCISYDVFGNNLIESPKSVKRRWKDIEAGCTNIIAIWDSIKKPPDNP